jgi:hypothetical protein
MLTNENELQHDMEVVSADGALLGRIDAVLACDLKLGRGCGADVAHLVPLAFIQRVDGGTVRLVVTEHEARRSWRETY